MGGSSILNNGVINQGNAPAILAGALAIRPAQGYEGLIYIANDAGNEAIFQYTGGAWINLTAGGGGVGTLQQVTALGNQTTFDIQIIQLGSAFSSFYVSTGNTAAILSDGVASLPTLNFILSPTSGTKLKGDNATALNVLQLPDNSGILATIINNTFPTDVTGNIDLPTLPITGTWAPAFTNLSGGLNTVISAEQWNYVRTGSIVTCFGSCAVDTNAGAGVQENFQVDLPIASNFTGGNVCSAAGSAIGDQATRWQGGFIEPDLASVTGKITTYFDILPLQTIIASFHFSYLIV